MTFLFDGASPWTDDNDPTDLSRLKSVLEHSGIAVSVYIVGSPGDMRHAIPRDVTSARGLGLGVVPNWERAADYFATCDLAGATQAGAEALTACRALGFPDDGSVAVAFSFDFQCPPSRYGEMLGKLQAAERAMGGHYQAIAYAQQGLCDYLAAHGCPGPHWLMASTWGEPYNPGSRNVALVQSHNAAGGWINSPVTGTDINTITQPSRLPAWWPDGSPYTQGEDMPLTATDVKLILDTEITTLSGQKVTVERLLQGSNANSWDALQQVTELKTELDAIKTQLTQAGTTGVDVSALAAALAQHLQLEAK